MSKIEDGGPAFPVEMSYDDNGIPFQGKQTGLGNGWHEGMTLRDWFATHAPEPPPHWWGESLPDCAGRAQWGYQYADAMLAARKRS